MRVSVLVSTCNRCDKLRMLLDTMKAKGAAWPTETEVLVIDNNSSDATKQVVTEYTRLENPVFRYLWESEPGKSRALNVGIREARGELIAFTDDDCIPSPNWVASILKEFDSDSELSVLGGRVELYDKRDLPQAILLSNSRTIVTNAREVCETPAIIGANMAFRKTVLKVTRGFDPLLGPGSICEAFEDLDLIYRALKRKVKIVYSPEVTVFHNHGRKTELDENKTSFAYALGRGAFFVKYILRLDFQIAKIALRELSSLTKTLTKGVLARREFPYHRLALPAIFLGAFYYCQGRLFWKRFPKTLRERTHAH
jgi:glycosyltransferase involved in cell wall biosynthesis